jgi:hypothetical protein
MPLLDLAAHGDVSGLRAALEAGAGPHPREGELAPLYLASTPEVIAVLLEHGADPNWQTERGETALTRAAHDGALDRLRALLAGGADTDMPRSEWPPLFYAAMAGHLEVVDALARAGASLERVHEGWTALAIAVDHGRHAIVDRLLALAPGVARRGVVDPVGLARARGDELLALGIEALRWSVADQGVRGRLRVQAPQRDGQPCRVQLELENVGAELRAVPTDDPFAFEWELWCDGEVIPTSLGREDVVHRLGWTMLPPGATVTVQASARGDWPSGALIDVVTKAWTHVRPGRLNLCATYRANREPRGGVAREARPLVLALPCTWVPRLP